MNKINPLRHPVTGAIIEWRSSAHTDIRQTFDRVKAEAQPVKNVRNIRKTK